MAASVRITDETFALAVEAQRFVVVDMWAPWCGPCRTLGPVIDRLADRYEGQVTFAKLDVDENPETAARLRVQSIPTLLFFSDGKLVDRTSGALPESLLVTKIQQLLHAPIAAPIAGPVAAHIAAGKLRPLAAWGAKRLPSMPNVPTFLELGYKDVEFYIWVGLFAPVKTPDALVQTIRRDIGRAIEEPDFAQNMAKLGAPINYRDGPAFAEFLNKDA